MERLVKRPRVPWRLPMAGFTTAPRMGRCCSIEPNKKEYLERGRFEQPDRSNSPAWSHPVIANGKLYVRDQDELLCYDISRK